LQKTEGVFRLFHVICEKALSITSGRGKYRAFFVRFHEFLFCSSKFEILCYTIMVNREISVDGRFLAPVPRV